MLEQQFYTWKQNSCSQNTERRKNGNSEIRKEIENIAFRHPVVIFRRDKKGNLKKVRKIEK